MKTVYYGGLLKISNFSEREMIGYLIMNALKKLWKPLKKLWKQYLAVTFIFNDAINHFKYSAPDDHFLSLKTKEFSKRTILEKDLHRIEKGLSMNNARKIFGLEVYSRIRMFRDSHLNESDYHHVNRANQALGALEAWQKSGDRSLGVLTETVSPLSNDDLRSLYRIMFQTRKSIRNFSDGVPRESEIVDSISWALNSPSVCNRQSWRVWYVTDHTILEKILALQNGNAGFNNLNALLVFGIDRRKFTLGTERNQPWIDGGIFAMSTVWALHAHGIGTCFLNWSTSPRHSRLLRRHLQVEEYIEFITLCAVGHFDKDTLVAISPRKKVIDYLSII